MLAHSIPAFLFGGDGVSVEIELVNGKSVAADVDLEKLLELLHSDARFIQIGHGLIGLDHIVRIKY